MNVDDIPFSEGTPTDLMAGPFRMNRCYYIDNLEALPLLPEKSIDLCLTDPPYNINPKHHKLSDGANRYKQHAVFYDDNKKEKEWEDFCNTWFMEARRVSNTLFFTPGEPNLWIYADIERPYDMLIHYKRDSQGGGKASHLLKHEHIFVYGKINHRQKLPVSVLDIPLGPDLVIDRKTGYIHWCPKISSLWYSILNRNKPTDVFDPFLGSGTTAQVAESLGIPWLGFEIMEEYRPDIEKRIKLGIKERQKPKQETLF